MPSVWLVNQYFGPGLAPTGRLLESLAEALLDAGYDVTVFCGTSDYHRPGTPGSAPPRFPGRVVPIGTWPATARSAWGKILSAGLFVLGLAWKTLWRRLPDNVIVLTTPPVLHGVMAWRRRWSRRPCRLLLWNMDLYPDVLAATGTLSSRSWLHRVARAWQRRALQQIDAAVALDEAMAERLREYGVRHVEIIPNWDVARAEPALDDASRPQKTRSPGAPFQIVYSGNYGRGHDLKELWAWLRAHPEQRHLKFTFLGGGARWGEVQAAAREFPHSVTVLDYLPENEYRRLVHSADFGLIALRTECAGCISPSKLYAFLAAGKPVLYLGPNRGNVAEALAEFGCGLQARDDGPEGVAQRLDELRALDEAGYARLQAAARKAAARFHVSAGTAAWLNLLRGTPPTAPSPTRNPP